MSRTAEVKLDAEYCGLWNCDAETYFSDVSCYSGSMLLLLQEFSRKFHDQYISRTMQLDPMTLPMQLGSMKHIAVFEPHRWDEFVEIIPADVLASNGAKSTKAYKEWAADRPGKILAKEGELDVVRGMIDAIHANEVARNAVCGEGLKEQALRWKDEVTGLPMKSRLDIITLSETVIVDLKKWRNNSREGFSKACADYSYHVKAAIYEDAFEAVFGRRPDAFLHVTVSDEKPYRVATYRLDDDDIQQGRDEYRGLLDRLAHHLETGDWRAPEEIEINEIRLPTWKRRRAA